MAQQQLKSTRSASSGDLTIEGFTYEEFPPLSPRGSEGGNEGKAPPKREVIDLASGSDSSSSSSSSEDSDTDSSSSVSSDVKLAIKAVKLIKKRKANKKNSHKKPAGTGDPKPKSPTPTRPTQFEAMRQLHIKLDRQRQENHDLRQKLLRKRTPDEPTPGTSSSFATITRKPRTRIVVTSHAQQPQGNSILRKEFEDVMTKSGPARSEAMSEFRKKALVGVPRHIRNPLMCRRINTLRVCKLYMEGKCHDQERGSCTVEGHRLLHCCMSCKIVFNHLEHGHRVSDCPILQ